MGLDDSSATRPKKKTRYGITVNSTDRVEDDGMNLE